MKLALLTLSFCLVAADDDAGPRGPGPRPAPLGSSLLGSEPTECMEKGQVDNCDLCCPESQCLPRPHKDFRCVKPKPTTSPSLKPTLLPGTTASPTGAPTECGDDFVDGCVTGFTEDCDECCGGAENCGYKGMFKVCVNPCTGGVAYKPRKPRPSSMVVAAPVFYAEEE